MFFRYEFWLLSQKRVSFFSGRLVTKFHNSIKCQTLRSMNFVLLRLPIDFVYPAKFTSRKFHCSDWVSLSFSLRRRVNGERKSHSVKWSFPSRLSFSVFRSSEKVFHLTEAFHKHTLTPTLFYVKYIRIYLVKRAVGLWKFMTWKMNFKMLLFRWRLSSTF